MAAYTFKEDSSLKIVIWKTGAMSSPAKLVYMHISGNNTKQTEHLDTNSAFL
jgi:hypothetical protein